MNQTPEDKGSAAFMMLVLLCLSLISIDRVAARVITATNVQLLTGSGYELGSDDRDLFTFEHSRVFDRGDAFFFFDVTSESASDETSIYGEANVRVALPNSFQINKSIPMVRRVYGASSIELGEDIHSYLLGLGASLDIPSFRYFNVNVFVRQSHRDFVVKGTDLGGQLNMSWQLPFTLGKWHMKFEGHLDYSFSENGGDRPKHDNLNSAPRLLVDVSRWRGTQERFFAGIEYQVWRHKFGIQGVHENVVQAMVKVNF